jgi:diguanylate cyclase (GGDEF)-like protein/PAS domain S-box-containing protein
MTVLGTAFYAFPSWHIAIWSAIGLTSAGAMVTGVVRNKPRRRLPWLLLATALLLFNAGDFTYFLLTDVLGEANPFPSPADAFYLGTFLLVATGLLSLARSGSRRRDWASLVDTLIFTTAAGLLSWIFLINPYVRNPDLTVVEKAISISYPLGDVVILATIARLLVAARRSTAITLLASGGVGVLVADVLYGLNQLGGSWHVGGPIDIGWILFYGLWGCAALHPSMVTLTEPRVVRQSEVTARRLVLLTLSSLIAPAVLLIEGITGRVSDGPVIALVSAAMFVLVLSRLSGVVDTHRRALVRERGLRDAGAALVLATEVYEVTETVRRAVARMLPMNTPHRVILTINMTDRPSYGPAEPFPSGPSGPRTASAASGPRAIRFQYTRTLDPALAEELGHFDVTLRCPFTLHDRFPGDPGIGALLVAAEESTLLTLQGMVEVLAAQAALALERITLNSELSRRSNEEYFRTLVQNTADVILIVDDDHRIKYASPSAHVVFGRVALVGVALSELIRRDDLAPAAPPPGFEHNGEACANTDWTVQRPDGLLVQVEVSSRDLRQDPTVGGLVVTLRDVTERRRLERELTHRAYHDALTGLANRLLFQERVEQAMARSEFGEQVVGVLFVDLDDFKVVNDTLGHETGDLLLIAVSQRIVGALSSDDLAARLGGDEFAVLIEDAADPTDLERVADRLVRTLAEPFRISGNLISGAVSIGVATNADASDGQDLLRLADLALYVAKGAGKGQWRRYQPTLHTAFLERLELRGALDQAAADGAFALQYQPIVALTNRSTVGFEALVRWHHPTRGLLPPNEFIDVAEETGLIVPIGNWVLENAMAAAVRWQRALAVGQQAHVNAVAEPYVSINISVRQFRTRGIVEKISRELTLSGLSPRSLMLEITESLLLRDDEQVWADLTGLRQMGVRVAIDDFGTGHSSLGYLRHVPIDVVKIDRLFVNALSTSPQQRAVVDSVVQLARTLGLDVIAEGIEQSDDRELLSNLGCPYGQGYLFSHPLSYGDAIKWLLADHVAAA